MAAVTRHTKDGSSTTKRVIVWFRRATRASSIPMYQLSLRSREMSAERAVLRVEALMKTHQGVALLP